MGLPAENIDILRLGPRTGDCQELNVRRVLSLVSRLFAFGSMAAGLGSGPAFAQPLQPGRMAIEAVAAISTSSSAADDPFVFLDLANTFRVTEKLDVIVRPYVRRLPGGDWDALLYQAQIRWQPLERVRLDAGIISTPLGLGTFELRQDLNPLVGSPFYYFAPLPAFERPSDRVQLFSGGYPLGAVISVSGTWWDARTGVTDGTPTRARKIFANNNPSPAAQFIAGGGVTPVAGLRLGAGLAHGPYRGESDTDFYSLPDTAVLTGADATVFNLEAEYAFGYTRLSAEWVRDEFENNGAPAVSRGFYVQAAQTITPRIFAASRFTQVSSPTLVDASLVRSTRKVLELSGGYRLTPQLTLKAGYEGGQRFGVTAWTHAAVGSVVWARRWF
jgi:hypothetical protein